MHLPKGGRNFNTWKAKAIRLPRTFSLDHPQRELGQLFFHIIEKWSSKKSRYTAPLVSAANCFVISGCPRATAFQSI